MQAPRQRQDNPIVFLDVQIGDKLAGHLIIELRADITPKTAENFRRLCTGETKDPHTGRCRHYAHWWMCFPFHRVVKDKFAQSGDFINHDGSGGECTFDQPGDDAFTSHTTTDNDILASAAPDRVCFEDENLILRHTGPGVLSMVNSGPDSNTSQFYLHFAAQPAFDNKHVVFGCLMGEESFQVLHAMNSVATQRGDPIERVKIVKCGQLFPS